MGPWGCLGEVTVISLTEVESPTGSGWDPVGPCLTYLPILEGKIKKGKERRQQREPGGHPVNIVICPNLFLLVLIYPKQKGGKKTSLP